MRTDLKMTLLILQEMELLRHGIDGFRQQLVLRPEPPRRPGESADSRLRGRA